MLLPDQPEPVGAVIRQIGARVEMGVLVAVIARLKNVPSGLRAGQGVRLRVDANPVAAQTVAIPINAVLLGAQADEGGVFVFDPATGRVAKRRVRLHLALLEGERVAVTGLRPGERIVAAGAAFLRDGEAVTVWRPDGASDGSAKNRDAGVGR